MASRRMETKPVITCLKTLLIIYSFVFWITGVILLAVGVWGKLTLGTYISLIAENSTNAPYVLIGTGTTIIVFGLFGCFATCRGSPWMLKLYAMFLSLVFLAELVAGISGFVFRHEIKDTFLRTYTEAIQNYNKNDERSHAVDNVQESLSCCGIQSYTNWSTSQDEDPQNWRRTETNVIAHTLSPARTPTHPRARAASRSLCHAPRPTP
ncbi:tetraspanin-7 isoform X2 [Nothoprocta perdicaria]|uniref:tetraspanin-7 isoform X2 n=1 Tax=Nothoprocta perdicaria TaxID=30464 RepID=UPI000E1C26B6|nr:tetraspanin-7 isoform X2 [Nothoprocta perdicaria]